MSEDQYTGILNAIQQVNADLQEFKHEVNKKFNKVNTRITRIDKKVDIANVEISGIKRVQDALFNKMGWYVGVFTPALTFLSFFRH